MRGARCGWLEGVDGCEKRKGRWRVGRGGGDGGSGG